MDCVFEDLQIKYVKSICPFSANISARQRLEYETTHVEATFKKKSDYFAFDLGGINLNKTATRVSLFLTNVQAIPTYCSSMHS